MHFFNLSLHFFLLNEELSYLIEGITNFHGGVNKNRSE